MNKNINTIYNYYKSGLLIIKRQTSSQVDDDWKVECYDHTMPDLIRHKIYTFRIYNKDKFDEWLLISDNDKCHILGKDDIFRSYKYPNRVLEHLVHYCKLNVPMMTLYELFELPADYWVYKNMGSRSINSYNKLQELIINNGINDTYLATKLISLRQLTSTLTEYIININYLKFEPHWMEFKDNSNKINNFTIKSTKLLENGLYKVDDDGEFLSLGFSNNCLIVDIPNNRYSMAYVITHDDDAYCLPYASMPSHEVSLSKAHVKNVLLSNL